MSDEKKSLLDQLREFSVRAAEDYYAAYEGEGAIPTHIPRFIGPLETDFAGIEARVLAISLDPALTPATVIMFVPGHQAGRTTYYRIAEELRRRGLTVTGRIPSEPVLQVTGDVKLDRAFKMMHALARAHGPMQRKPLSYAEDIAEALVNSAPGYAKEDPAKAADRRPWPQPRKTKKDKRHGR